MDRIRLALISSVNLICLVTGFTFFSSTLAQPASAAPSFSPFDVFREGPVELHPAFTSPDGDEYRVSFRSYFTAGKELAARIPRLTFKQKASIAEDKFVDVLDYLFGPLTARELGSPQRRLDLQIDWDHAFVRGNRTFVPYSYLGIWILDAKWIAAGNLKIPVPFSEKSVKPKAGKSVPKLKLSLRPKNSILISGIQRAKVARKRPPRIQRSRTQA